LFKHATIYGIGAVFNRIAGFLLIPVYTRFLDISEYGVLSLWQVFINLTQIVFELGINAALFRYYFEYDNEDEKKTLVGTTFLSLIFFDTIFFLLVFSLSSFFSTALFDTISYSYIIKIAAITSFLNVLLRIPLSLMRADNLSIQFSLFNSLKFLLTIVFNIIFVIYLNRKIIGIAESMLLTHCFLTLILLPYFIKKIRIKFSLKKFVQLCKFGIPLIPTNLVAVLLAFSDRFILKIFVGLHDLGIYSLGYKIGSIVNMIAINGLVLAWPPTVMNIIQNKNLVNPDSSKFQIAKFCTYIIFFISWLVLFLSIFTREILKLMATSKYIEASIIVPIIAFSYLFFAFYKFFETGIFIIKKTHYYPLVTGCAAFINIGLNILLIPIWGIKAAAINTFIGYGIMAIYILYIANKVYPIPYEYKRITIMTVVCLGLTFISNIAYTDLIIFNLLIKAGIFLSFPFILYMTGFFSQYELLKIKHYKNHVLQKARII